MPARQRRAPDPRDGALITRRPLLAALAAWLAAAASIQAQDPAQAPAAPEPPRLAEQIMVTAAREQTRVGRHAGERRHPAAGRAARDRLGFLDDALRQVVGFSLFRRTSSRTANPTAQGVSLRGLGASGASRALVLADGIPLNDPFGGWVYWARQPRLGVERLEVLRGGAADLYGSGALGGVVQLVSRGAAGGARPRGGALGRRGVHVRRHAHGARRARRLGGPALRRGLHDGRLRSGGGSEPGCRGQ